MNEAIEQNYEGHRNSRSDINEHLPVLRAYADQCGSVLEIGHRGGSSGSAFMVSKCQIFHSVDIRECPNWYILDELLYQNGPSWKEFKHFHSDSMEFKPPIHGYDMIFIDGLHNGEQLYKELRKYAPYCRKYFALHDTVTFGGQGESSKMGLRDAILDFLLLGPNETSGPWFVLEHRENNNGLTILKRA